MSAAEETWLNARLGNYIMFSGVCFHVQERAMRGIHLEESVHSDVLKN